MHLYDIVIRPIMSEKTDVMADDHNQYVFEVVRKANKRQVKKAVESIFEVSVTDVRTMIVPGKSRRWGRIIRKTPSWKKAIVTLVDGDAIDVVGRPGS